MDMHPPSNDELDDLPHMVLTSDIDWDPSIVDNDMDLEAVSYTHLTLPTNREV